MDNDGNEVDWYTQNGMTTTIATFSLSGSQNTLDTTSSASASDSAVDSSMLTTALIAKAK
jgi:hypothetical protein